MSGAGWKNIKTKAGEYEKSTSENDVPINQQRGTTAMNGISTVIIFGFCTPLLLHVMFGLLGAHFSSAKRKKSLTRTTPPQSNT